MGGAEHSGVNLMLRKLLFHILEIHAPNAAVIPNQRRVNDVIAVV